MRVGLPHLGQLVDLVVSISFLRSAVFAIFAMMIVLRSARVCTRGAEIEDDCGISQLLEFTLKRRKCRRSGLVGDRKALANMPGFLHFVDRSYGKIFSGESCYRPSTTFPL